MCEKPCGGKGAFPVSTHSIHKKPHDFYSKKKAAFTSRFCLLHPPSLRLFSPMVSPAHLIFYSISYLHMLDGHVEQLRPPPQPFSPD